MWIQEGNSVRWAIYQDGGLYYCFKWDWKPSRRYSPVKYHIEWAITAKLGGSLGHHAPWIQDQIEHGWIPPLERAKPWQYVSKDEKDRLWKQLMADPVSFIVRQRL